MLLAILRSVTYTTVDKIGQFLIHNNRGFILKKLLAQLFIVMSYVGPVGRTSTLHCAKLHVRVVMDSRVMAACVFKMATGRHLGFC